MSRRMAYMSTTLGVKPSLDREIAPAKKVLVKRELSAYVFLIAGSWSAWQGLSLSLETINGRPWSNWNGVLLGGAACLIAGGLSTLLSKRRVGWGYRMSLLGSIILTTFFVPATVNTLRSYLSNVPEVYGTWELAFALAAPLVVLASLIASTLLVLSNSRQH
jgi:hypothetical protein